MGIRGEQTEAVVTALVERGLVDPGRREAARDVVAKALGETTPTLPGGVRGRVAELAGYLGASLVVGAAAIFLIEQWESLGGGAQVALLVLAAVVLGAAGLAALVLGGGPSVIGEPSQSTRRRLTGTLFVGAAVAAGFAVGRALDLAAEQGGPLPVLAGAAIAAVLGSVAYTRAPTAVGLVGIAGASIVAVVALVGELFDAAAAAMGPALIVLAAGWLALTELGVFRERLAARSVGAAVALFGAQIPAFDSEYAWVGYLLTLLVAVAGFAGYLRTLAWPYLAVGVLASTFLVPEVVTDWTDGSVGTAGAVLLAGLTLLAASLAGLRYRKEVRSA